MTGADRTGQGASLPRSGLDRGGVGGSELVTKPLWSVHMYVPELIRQVH